MSHPRTQDLSPGFTPPHNTRFRRGRGHRYIPDVVERVRVLVEGTGLSQAAIAARTGVSQSTVWRFARRHGWVRPAGVERWTRTIPAARAGLADNVRSGFERVAALAERERQRLASTEDEAESAGAIELAEIARQRAADHASRSGQALPRLAAEDRGSGLLRLSGRAPTLPGRRRGDDVVRQARALVETTTTIQAEIARQLGINKATLSRWRQEGGWFRPPACRYLGRRRGRRWMKTVAARDEAWRRIGAAEALLEEMEREERASPERIAAALAGLDGALAALRSDRSGARGASPVGMAGSSPAMTREVAGDPPPSAGEVAFAKRMTEAQRV